MTQEDLLTIAKRYGTDKVQNGYIPHFEKFFSSMRNDPINILEIGVKRESPRSQGACSLKTWKDYFPNGQVYGIDIDPFNKKYEQDRISIFIGNQGDQKFLDEVCSKVDHFDIIIDDGSHVNSLTIESYEGLWPHLRSGGIYAIEDTGCSYIDLDAQGVRHKSEKGIDWCGMHLLPTSYSYKNDRKDFLDFIQEKLTRMDLGSSSRWRSFYGLSKPDTKSITFFSCICFIEKL
jgi:hypothetical protein